MKNSETALPDLAKREAELYQRITEGVMQGRLTAGGADILKRDFYRLLDMEAKYRASGGLSFGEHAALALELENSPAVLRPICALGRLPCLMSMPDRHRLIVSWLTLQPSGRLTAGSGS